MDDKQQTTKDPKKRKYWQERMRDKTISFTNSQLLPFLTEIEKNANHIELDMTMIGETTQLIRDAFNNLRVAILISKGKEELTDKDREKLKYIKPKKAKS